MKLMIKRNISLFICFIMLFSLIACSNQTANEPEVNEPEQPEDTGEEVSESLYKSGTYQSQQAGHNGFIDVSVSFSESEITDIVVTKSFETIGVSDKALNNLPKTIVENQSLNVDAITGATISSMSVLRAVEDCVKQANGDPAKLKAEKSNESPKEIEKSADVIIIGAGGSGLAAAVAASQNGVTVIIVEKVSYAGGNTMVSGGIYNAADPVMQKDVQTSPGAEKLVVDAINEVPANDEHAELITTVKQQYEDYKNSGATYLFDSPEFHALQTWNGGDKVGDLSIIKYMTNNSLDSLHWLMNMGYEIDPDLVQGAGALYQRTHTSVEPLGTGFINAYLETLEKSDVEIVYNTSAKELIVTDGKVVGVKAEDTKGNTYTFKANKNVIIATGGFAGNKELVKQYNTSGKWPDLSVLNDTNLPGVSGDGILMATAVGAGVRDMDQIQLLQVCSDKTGLLHANVYPHSVAGYVFINQEGNRFVREDGRRDDICLAALDQTGGKFYLLQSSESIPDPDSATDLANIPLKDLIASGDVLVGDTLEDVCNQAGVDPVNAQASVDAFNKVIDEGKLTDEFGRALFKHKLETGPWYIISRAPSVHHTMGGLTINTNCQVLDTEGNPIQGLYAAGEVTGGIHGGNRLGGNAIVDTVVFGRTAGEQASQ